jgi:hypothetical protein
MKAILAIIIIAIGAYGAIGTTSAKQTTSIVQSSLDRMNAVEASLK